MLYHHSPALSCYHDCTVILLYWTKESHVDSSQGRVFPPLGCDASRTSFFSAHCSQQLTASCLPVHRCALAGVTWPQNQWFLDLLWRVIGHNCDGKMAGVCVRVQCEEEGTWTEVRAITSQCIRAMYSPFIQTKTENRCKWTIPPNKVTEMGL